MAQYRAIHTKITQSFDFNEMPDDFTRLMWALMPLALDREGRGIYNSSWLRSKLFPLREDVTADKIMTAIDWMIDRKMLVKYEVNGRTYFYSPTFKNYQRGLEREALSVLPSPNEQSNKLTPEPLKTYSRPTHDLLSSNSSLNGTELNGTELNGTQTEEESGAIPPSPAPYPAPKDYQFSTGWQVRVFSDVTGIPGIPGTDMPRVMEALDYLRGKYGTELELEQYLIPYFQNWINRKTKDGRRYSRSNCAWLYDLAVAGEPLPGDDKPEVVARPDPNCPKCGGIGFIGSGAKYGEAEFGKLVQCSCVKVREVVNAGPV